jgi:hypothetical protein
MSVVEDFDWSRIWELYVFVELHTSNTCRTTGRVSLHDDSHHILSLKQRKHTCGRSMRADPPPTAVPRPAADSLGQWMVSCAPARQRDCCLWCISLNYNAPRRMWQTYLPRLTRLPGRYAWAWRVWSTQGIRSWWSIGRMRRRWSPFLL